MSSELLRLCEMTPNQSGDLFAVLASQEQSQTKDGKPYFRVDFRDAKRKATAMIWSDHGHFADCSENWKVGTFYKLRGKYTENSYGPQIDIERIRPVEDADAEQGFSPDDFYETSRYDREEMFEELLGLAQEHITEEPLQRLVVELLTEHADTVKHHAAASRNHHAFMAAIWNTRCRSLERRFFWPTNTEPTTRGCSHRFRIAGRRRSHRARHRQG